MNEPRRSPYCATKTLVGETERCDHFNLKEGRGVLVARTNLPFLARGGDVGLVYIWEEAPFLPTPAAGGIRN